jgi:hypothetical protein
MQQMQLEDSELLASILEDGRTEVNIDYGESSDSRCSSAVSSQHIVEVDSPAPRTPEVKTEGTGGSVENLFLHTPTTPEGLRDTNGSFGPCSVCSTHHVEIASHAPRTEEMTWRSTEGSINLCSVDNSQLIMQISSLPPPTVEHSSVSKNPYAAGMSSPASTTPKLTLTNANSLVHPRAAGSSQQVADIFSPVQTTPELELKNTNGLVDDAAQAGIGDATRAASPRSFTLETDREISSPLDDALGSSAVLREGAGAPTFREVMRDDIGGVQATCETESIAFSSSSSDYMLWGEHAQSVVGPIIEFASMCLQHR